MVPSQGEHPFDALKGVLQYFVVSAGLPPGYLGEELYKKPESFSDRIRTIISKGTDRNAIVLFLDQMEELFTGRGKKQTKEQTDTFLSALYRASREIDLWVIATIRSDFLHYCHHHQDMLSVLNGHGHYALGRAEPYMMHDMIVKPAERAGLKIPKKLVSRLIQETGSDPGNLPLLAFVLQRLFQERQHNALTEGSYDAFGSLEGSIRDHVKSVEEQIAKEIGPDALDRLPDIFQFLLVVGIEGQPTRRRARKTDIPPEVHHVVDILATKRLLSTEGEGQQATVSVAHEKLFEAWPALAGWIAANRDDLMFLRQAELAAREWSQDGYHPRYLWQADRRNRLQGIIAKFGDQCTGSVAKEFSAPQDRIITALSNDALTHADRQRIGELLTWLGDPRLGVGLRDDGIPDIEWVEIAGRSVDIPFSIARYPVTHSQYQAFIDAEDGYRNEEWWKGLERREGPDAARWQEPNAPRETVSWYEAVAFCRWLTQQYRMRDLLEEDEEISLPTEAEKHISKHIGSKHISI